MTNRIINLLIAILILVSPGQSFAALTFGGATNDNVNFGSAASLDNLNNHTVITWIYPTTLTNGRGWFGKQADTPLGGAIDGFRISVGDEVRAIVGEQTVNAQRVSNNANLTVNKWWFVAYTYEEAANPDLHIYLGGLDVPAFETTYGTDQLGTGGMRSNAGKNLFVGNDSTGTQAFQGRVAFVGQWNRVMTLGEIWEQQFAPHKTSGNVLFSQIGFNGTGTQTDWSGLGNNGTASTTGGVSPHVPLGFTFAQAQNDTTYAKLSSPFKFFADIYRFFKRFL